MRKLIKPCFWLSCISLYSSGLAGAESSHPKLHFSHLSELEYHREIESLLLAAHRSLGHEVVISHMPLARSFSDANTGKLDGLFARVENAGTEYKNLIIVPEVIATFELTLVINSETCNYCTDLSDLHRVASVIGFSALKRYLSENKISDGNIVYVPMRKNVFKLMERGRVDGMIVSKELIPSEMVTDNPHWQYITLQKEGLFHYLHKEHQHLIKPLTEAIRVEKQNRLK